MLAVYLNQGKSRWEAELPGAPPGALERKPLSMAEHTLLRIPASELQEAWFQPMGLSLQVVSNSPAILAAAEASFRGYGAGQPNDTSHLTFRLFAHAVDDGKLNEPIFRTDGPLIYQTTGRDSTLVVDRARAYAYGCFSPTTLANPLYFRWHFLELALYVMLEWRGFLGVHAGALVRNGRSLLLRAPSGQGKSTLTYAGARRQFQILAEEVVWLDIKRQLWWGAPWTVRLLPDAKRLFPELAAAEPALQLNGEWKLAIDLERVWPGSTTVSVRPGGVVLLRRRPGGKSGLERLDFAEAKAEWRTGCAGLEHEAPHYDHHIEALLRAETYRLNLGDDIDVALELLASLCDRGGSSP